MKSKAARIILLTAFMFAGASCNDKLCGCTVMELSTFVIVSDSEGRNLLNPETPGYFKEEDIRIYFVRNGVREEVYRANLDTPRNFSIDEYNSDHEYAMKLFPYEGNSDKEVTTTIIRWNKVDEDTVACEVRREDSYTGISKVWYNGELVCDDNDGPQVWGETQVPRLIRVIK